MNFLYLSLGVVSVLFLAYKVDRICNHATEKSFLQWLGKFFAVNGKREDVLRDPIVEVNQDTQLSYLTNISRKCDIKITGPYQFNVSALQGQSKFEISVKFQENKKRSHHQIDLNRTIFV